MKDVKASLPGNTNKPQAATSEPADQDEDEDDIPVKQVQKTRGSWLSYFSVEAMGLADYVDERSSSSALSTIGSYLPGCRQPTITSSEEQETVFDQDEEVERMEAERLFLTYSWWLLHEGWKEVADRVDEAVEKVFAG